MSLKTSKSRRLFRMALKKFGLAKKESLLELIRRKQEHEKLE
jgi:hypothetical protein